MSRGIISLIERKSTRMKNAIFLLIFFAICLILLAWGISSIDKTCKKRFGEEWYGRGSPIQESVCINTKTGDKKYL